MGFRSTFITEDKFIEWPQWFRDKWANFVNFPDKHGCISSKIEAKTYMTWEKLHLDIQKCVPDNRNIVLVYLHECGGITRCEIHNDKILWSEPETWNQTDGVTHNYCYGCSDVK